MAKKQANPQSKPQPIEEVRIGAIKAAIWRNEGENGARFNVTFQRLYKTEQGQWQSTDSFSGHDLLLLAKVADATHTGVAALLAGKRFIGIEVDKASFDYACKRIERTWRSMQKAKIP